MIVSNPLIIHHEKLGAELDPGNTPLSFTNAVEEYWAVKKSSGMADMSSLGRLVITGKDRVSFLNGLLTNDATKLRDSEGQHTALLNNKARVTADLYLYGQPDALLIDTGNAAASKVKEDLDRFVITEDVQIRDATRDLVQITIQGSESGSAIKETLGTSVDDLKPLQQKTLGPSTLVSRDRTGQGGYDIILPTDEAEAVWQGFLLKSGVSGVKPVGARALEILRLEAGYPKYGVDVDENTIILEAGYKDAISFTKGCYLGQEVVARASHIGRVNKQLVQLEIETNEPPLSRSKLRSDKIDAGFVTSAAFSPGIGKVVALAYANRDYAKDGTRLSVEGSEKSNIAIVTRVL